MNQYIPTELQSHSDMLMTKPMGRLPPLVAYWNVIRRHRWLIAGVVALALALGLLLTILATPGYKATARVQIDRQGEQVTDVKEVNTVDSGEDQEFYQTQYALLRAHSLAERVARKLNLASNEQFFAMFGRDPGAASEGPVGAGERNAQLRRAADLLIDNLTIAPIRGSSLVDIQFESPDPILSAQVANTWVDEFIAATLDRRFNSTQDARRFLEERLSELRGRMEQSERDLVNYAADRGIVTLSQSEDANGLTQPARTLTSLDLEALNQALTEATQERISAESALRAQQPGRQTSPTLAGLRQSRAEAAAQLAQLSTRFESGYPEVQAVRSRLESIDRAIADENSRVRSESQQAFNAARAREATLSGRVNALKGSLVSEKAASIQYNIYQREVDTNRQLYDSLLQRYKEIGVAGVASNNVSVVDRALVPRVASSPDLLLNLILALIFGLMLALLLVVALEQIDQKLKDPADVSNRLGLPLLGVIPKVAEDLMAEAIADPKSDITEAYLSLQTNLSFLTDHGVPRSLLFTSTRPNEGKSNSTVALARSLARTGKRVLLVDADLRNSSSHRLLGVENQRGLSNYLAGDEFNEELLTKTNIPNLSLLSAGPKPPNAGELLMSPRLSRLVQQANESFDVVLIDAPPVLGIADVPLVTKAAEGIVYTIELNGARLPQIQQSLERIYAARAKVFGALVTKVNATGSGYGYGYGYGYGRESDLVSA